jgi:Fe-S cluster biogenesis protein NfuA
MSDITLRQGVEMVIRTSIPEITEVLDVTDHEAGTDPFYRPDA